MKDFTVNLVSKGFPHPNSIEVKAKNKREAIIKAKEKYKRLYNPTSIFSVLCWDA